MKPLCNRITLALAAAALFTSSQFAFAQAEASASPEPGDAPAVEKIEVLSAESAPAEPAQTAAPTADAGAASEAATPSGFDSRRIEQRVDGTSTQEVIRIAPKPKKNVYRIDNKPNKPKVTPIAVIKGPVSPWGYASRYSTGQVNRPSAKDLQGNRGQTGGAGGTGLRSLNSRDNLGATEPRSSRSNPRSRRNRD